MTSPTRPVLRYHGGKWRLAPWIISHFPAHRCYVEPFGGGGSVLLRKQRAYAEVYNDLDGEVVNVFRVMRDSAPALQRAVELTPFARAEFDVSYQPSDDPIEQARRTMFRAAAGFGSILTRPNRDGTMQRTGFRATVKRSSTTPALDWQNITKQFDAYAERLRGVIVERRAASEVIERYDDTTTLHYVDPPYVHSTRGYDAGGSHRAYRFEMTDDDHRALAKQLRAVAGMVVLSGYACDLYDKELYPDWVRTTKETHADSARDRTEVLWLNPSCSRTVGLAA